MKLVLFHIRFNKRVKCFCIIGIGNTYLLGFSKETKKFGKGSTIDEIIYSYYLLFSYKKYYYEYHHPETPNK